MVGSVAIDDHLALSGIYRYRQYGRETQTGIEGSLGTQAYYYDAVLWAVDKGITNGTSDTTFSPDDDCLRSQIVTFLYRAYKGT